jgi:hypothetical protein
MKMTLLEMNSIITMMNMTLDSINNRIDLAKLKTDRFENIAIKSI